jgi:hypothetical protein
MLGQSHGDQHTCQSSLIEEQGKQPLERCCSEQMDFVDEEPPVGEESFLKEMTASRSMGRSKFAAKDRARQAEHL